MSGWRIVGVGLMGTVGVVLALLLAGSSHGLALLAYVLLLAGLALLVLLGRLRDMLPADYRFEQLLERERLRVEPIEQLQRMQRALTAAGWGEADL